MSDYRIRLIDTRHTTGSIRKVADAELHFTSGIFAGLKLIGFGIWEKRTGDGYNVTMPARQYSVNGERRSFALLRPGVAGFDDGALRRFADVIIDAYVAAEAAGTLAQDITGPAAL